MKFNALVVAAMVITSVNAAGKGGFRGLFKKGGRMTRPGPSYDTFDNEPESVVAQDAAESGEESRFPQVPPNNEPRPDLSHDTLLIDLISEYPQGPLENEPIPGSAQIPQVRESGSVFPQNLMDDDLNASQGLDPANKDQICVDLEDELDIFWGKVAAVDNEFHNQLSYFHKIMVIERTEKNEESKEGKKGDSNHKETQEWGKLYPRTIPKLREIRKKYNGLQDYYDGVWERLGKKNCQVKHLKRFSVEEMIQQGHFFDWQDKDGLDILREQQDSG
ncbi:hypothetical protein BASA61_003709 [Batrachochytrium salamandrivorans]|nr:hypothetical protein BASA61_003709 [Batrachochytrium salamandrivorans]KAH9263079.1 hypothetical protein BASA83_013595 [Batrachochytrium salamandrivorans]